MNRALQDPCSSDSTKRLLKLLLVLCNHTNPHGSQTNKCLSKEINEAFVSQKVWKKLCEVLDSHLRPSDDLHRKSPISLYSVWRECQRNNKHRRALSALWLILKRKDDLPKKFFCKLNQEVEQYLVSFFPTNKFTENNNGINIT